MPQRPALLPVISYMGPATAALITGSVVIERIYSIPGLGSYFVQEISEYFDNNLRNNFRPKSQAFRFWHSCSFLIVLQQFFCKNVEQRLPKSAIWRHRGRPVT